MNMQEVLKISCVREGELKPVTMEHFSENIEFQNTSYWGGGCFDMWGSYKEKEPEDNSSESSEESQESSPLLKKKNFERKAEEGNFKPQTHSDKLLELCSFRSLFHMGQVQVNLAKADRVTQAR
jgi:hypothetical protein